jgi:hypothetical protein
MYKELNVFATEPDSGMDWMHNDWFYEVKDKPNGVRIGKLYKSRNWASRAAKKLAKRVIHWYPV